MQAWMWVKRNILFTADKNAACVTIVKTSVKNPQKKQEIDL